MLKIENFEISKNKFVEFPSFCSKQLIMLGLHPLKEELQGVPLSENDHFRDIDKPSYPCVPWVV